MVASAVHRKVDRSTAATLLFTRSDAGPAAVPP